MPDVTQFSLAIYHRPFKFGSVGFRAVYTFFGAENLNVRQGSRVNTFREIGCSHSLLCICYGYDFKYLPFWHQDNMSV